MNKNVRIAIQLKHKEDSISENSGSIAYSDYQWDEKRFLYHANGNNEWVLFKDELTDYIEDMKDNIIITGPDKENLFDPSLVFLYQFDDNGNAYYSDQVNNKWKEWMKANYGNTKPNITYVHTDGLEIGVTPILHEKCVMTTVRFDGDAVDYASIGRLTEGLIERFVNLENNITFRVAQAYDKCMKIAHDLHLLDVNQDHKLTNIWAKEINANGFIAEVADWIPKLDFYQAPAKKYQINLNTSDSGYMYKYVLEETAKGESLPIFKTSIACESINPIPFAELTHTRNGILIDGIFGSNTETEYTRRDMLPHAWGKSMNTAFASNPSAPTVHNTEPLGDNDNQVNSVNGQVVVNYRRDVVTEVYHTMPWLRIDIECYNFGGNLVKTVNGVWDKTGSTKLDLTNQSMLAGTYTFKANLGGYYKVRTKLTVYWGTFGSWTDEVKLCYFSLARGNNSGGTWRINQYIFNNQSNRILTRCQLHGASKYEKNVIINGRGYGWGGNVNPPIDWDDNGTFGAPGSADHWDASFYGKIYAKPGCDFICKDFHNVGVSGTRDVSGSVHYPDASKYSILTTANLTVNYTGLKAKYSQDFYNTPFLFSPVTNDCTLMLRGGYTYNLISHCQNLNMRQIGVYKIDVGTIGVTYDNTLFYGRDVIVDQDFIITGKKRGYVLDVMGNAPRVTKMASGVPDIDKSQRAVSLYRSRRSNTLFIPYQLRPDEETGFGLITKINLVREFRLDEVPNKHLEIYTKEGKVFKCKVNYVESSKWTQVYTEVGNAHRAYVMLVDSTWLYVLTYHMNVDRIILNNVVGNTLELLLRDSSTKNVTNAYPMLEVPTERSIPVEYDGNVYYVEITEEVPELDDGVEPAVILDDKDKITGYLK